jgi:transcriptional regulator with XRE-family HTH domain
MAISKKVGEKIKQLRKDKGLTQEKLAELAKVDPKTIIEIENGNRKNPTFKTINKIANALRMSLKEII